MVNRTISSGIVHTVPPDVKTALLATPTALAAWEDITPLARNEWICWIISVKKEETRTEHIKRAVQDLVKGKRRPCCWSGCIHRTDKSMSASQRFVAARNSKKR